MKYKQLGRFFEIDGEVKNIGNVLHNLHKAYRDGTLTDAQIEFLENLGLVFCPERGMEEMYASLVEYKNIFGSISEIRVQGESICFNDKVVNVGRQISAARERYKKGLLLQKEIDFLESLGMVWERPAGRRFSSDGMEQ